MSAKFNKAASKMIPQSGSQIFQSAQSKQDTRTRFCEMGDLGKAMELLAKFSKSHFELDTYCSILQLCAELKSLKDGKKVHRIISSKRVEIKGLLGTKLVYMYVKCGDLEKGRWVFDKIVNEKVFLWNFMMNEYAKIGNCRESISIFWKMRDFGVEMDAHTFSCVLKCFAAIGNIKESEWVHGYLLKSGFGSYNTVVNSLIAFYFKYGRVESACKLFDELDDKDVISWNSMVSGHAANGLSDRGFNVFEDMMCSGVDIDLVTMVSVMVICANVGTLHLGRALHGYAIKSSLTDELILSNSLLDMYSKCGDLGGAIQVFEKMGKRSVVSWTSLIAGYAREGMSDKAISMFREMEREGTNPDTYAITCILHACACNGSLEVGKDVHSYVRENNMESNLFVCNALMDMYAKCGSMEDALSVFSQMRVRDIVSWNTMIGGYSKNSLPNEALNMFIEMQRHSELNGITMSCILPACASLSALDKGREIHGHILRRGFLSDRIVVNALLDMYAKCGALALALLVFDSIFSKDLVSWTVMISGYGMHGYGKHIFELEPENTGYYVLLANIYAEAERWEEVKKLRERMSRRRLKKQPGCSWIEIKGRAQIFVAGDNSHHLSKKIQSLLKRVSLRMKEAGYLPKLQYALLNADDMEKEIALCGHSEKLAMACGILCLPPGKTVRVTKNLRVCGDCHEMAKFMSKMMRREILLRDSNRFHHFKDGRCSCRGYW
ncbi:E motif [Dillenia turbinata]|uniref:E motif n=1 Tax=Dillenia turbinata TaxID=194707 RepID=A0AAN8ULF7_9MAGN